MASDRKKKKQIDAHISSELFDDFDRFEHFLGRYWRHIVLGLTTVVVGVAAYFSYAQYQRRAEREACNAFAQAKTADEVQAVIEKYGNRKAAIFSRLKLVKEYAAKQEYSKAYAEFDKIAASKSAKDLLWRAKLDKGYLLEKEGKAQEAIEAFRKVGQDSLVASYVMGEADYALGRLLLQSGAVDQAKEALHKVANIRPENDAEKEALTLWQSQAKFLLGTL